MTEKTPQALIEKLFDPQTFTELQKYDGSGVTAGFGKIADTSVYAYIQDINVKSGAVNPGAAAKMKKIYASAVKYGAPVIAVFDSKGGEIGEGMELIDAYSDIIGNCARLSGVVPLISVVIGQCSGLNATLCRMSDIVIMTEDARMFFTPPFVAGDKEEETGKAGFNAGTGAADIIVKDSEEAVLTAKKLLQLLPQNNLETPLCDEFACSDVEITVSLKSSELLAAIADKESLVETGAGCGTSVTAFGALYGGAAGFVAFDKPETLLSSADAAKIARFVNLCDSFSLPVISIIDNEGFDGVHSKPEHEHACLISGTAKLAQVYASSTTPKINLITGKATGAAFILAGGFAGDFILAYEGSVISPITVKAAAVFLEQTEADYIENEASVQNALKKGYIDMVIAPSQARNALINAVEAVRDKRVSVPARKHVNYIF